MARGQHLEIEQSGCVFLTRKHLGGNPEHEGGFPGGSVVKNLPANEGTWT